MTNRILSAWQALDSVLQPPAVNTTSSHNRAIRSAAYNRVKSGKSVLKSAQKKPTKIPENFQINQNFAIELFNDVLKTTCEDENIDPSILEKKKRYFFEKLSKKVTKQFLDLSSLNLSANSTIAILKYAEKEKPQKLSLSQNPLGSHAISYFYEKCHFLTHVN